MLSYQFVFWSQVLKCDLQTVLASSVKSQMSQSRPEGITAEVVMLLNIDSFVGLKLYQQVTLLLSLAEWEHTLVYFYGSICMKKENISFSLTSERHHILVNMHWPQTSHSPEVFFCMRKGSSVHIYCSSVQWRSSVAFKLWAFALWLQWKHASQCPCFSAQALGQVFTVTTVEEWYMKACAVTHRLSFAVHFLLSLHSYDMWLLSEVLVAWESKRWNLNSKSQALQECPDKKNWISRHRVYSICLVTGKYM